MTSAVSEIKSDEFGGECLFCVAEPLEHVPAEPQCLFTEDKDVARAFLKKYQRVGWTLSFVLCTYEQPYVRGRQGTALPADADLVTTLPTPKPSPKSDAATLFILYDNTDGQTFLLFRTRQRARAYERQANVSLANKERDRSSALVADLAKAFENSKLNQTAALAMQLFEAMQRAVAKLARRIECWTMARDAESSIVHWLEPAKVHPLLATKVDIVD